MKVLRYSDPHQSRREIRGLCPCTQNRQLKPTRSIHPGGNPRFSLLTTKRPPPPMANHRNELSAPAREPDARQGISRRGQGRTTFSPGSKVTFAHRPDRSSSDHTMAPLQDPRLHDVTVIPSRSHSRLPPPEPAGAPLQRQQQRPPRRPRPRAEKLFVAPRCACDTRPHLSLRPARGTCVTGEYIYI